MSFKGALIDTGNVANLGIIKRNALLNSNEEVWVKIRWVLFKFFLFSQVLEGIENIVTLSKDEKNGIKLEEIKFESSPTASLCIVSGQNHLQQFERNKLKLSVKVFMFPETFARDDEAYLKSITGESIEALCKLLNVTYIDNLILSIQTDESDRVLPNLKQAWAAYETITKENRKILSLGSSDLNADQLCELYNSTQIKPSSSQINLDSCCDIPADLSSFAKSNSIQLLTHNDPLGEWFFVVTVWHFNDHHCFFL